MNSNKQQTTVDWIEQEMLKGNLSLKEILEQAKEIEKEKLEDSWVDGTIHWGTNKTFEQYYNETYGGKQ
jgi:hypothetical protein